MTAITVVTYSRKACTFENIVLNCDVAAYCVILTKINECAVTVINRTVGAVTGKIKLNLLVEKVISFHRSSI